LGDILDDLKSISFCQVSQFTHPAALAEEMDRQKRFDAQASFSIPCRAFNDFAARLQKGFNAFC
jgi:hypothetical protein